MSSIAQTLTNGIQEISAILPLLGTEQCEEQVGLALNNGFLYVAITPVSLFGSLGIVKAGFNTLLASIAISKYRILGAKVLDYMGFHPKGEVSQSIAIDSHQRGRFLAESQLEKLIQDEHIDDIDVLRLEAARGCFRWNIFMTVFTLVIPPAFGIVPYLFLIVRTQKLGTSLVGFPLWAFPIIRIVCNALCAVAVQFLIQIRILNIVKMRLIFNIVDRYAKKIGYPLEYIHLWSKEISSEMCIWTLQFQHKYWKQLDEAPKDLERATPGAFPGTSSVGRDKIPPRDKRDRVDNLLQQQMERHFPPKSPFTKLRKSWINILLLFTLLMAIPGSVLGYIGCFNVVQVDGLRSIGPILWLALEGSLCLLRILVWAVNPVWDDCGGIAFCMQLIEKSPLVTCSLYDDEVEKLGAAPVMREDDFLREVSAYSGPLASFNHKGIALYYIFTGTRSDEEKKSLYVIISNFREQTSRIFIRNKNGEGFRMYVSTLEPDARSYFTNVSVRFHTRSINDTPNPRNPEASAGDSEQVAQFSDPDFMRKFEKHYKEILHKLKPKSKTKDAKTEKRFKFRSGWSIGKMEEWGSTPEVASSKTPNSISGAILVFWRAITNWRPGDGLESTEGADASPSKLTAEDNQYIEFGQKERHAKRFCNELEKWTQRYLEVLNEDFRASLFIKNLVATRKLGSNRRILMILDAYEESEVEFLIMEARKQAEILLLRQLPPWRDFLSRKQQEMATTVTNGFKTEKSEVWKEKLASRLSNEWKISQKQLTELRVSRMVERLEEQSKLAHERIEEQKYDEATATSILDPWRRNLDLFEGEVPRTDLGRDLGREFEEYSSSVTARFTDRRSTFCDEVNAEKTLSTYKEWQFLQLFQRIEFISICKARLLFSMLEGQSECFDNALHEALGERLEGIRVTKEYYLGGPEEEREKLRFIRNHRLLEITPRAFKVFGGSVKMICTILKQTRGISAVDFLASSSDFPDSNDFEEIKNVVQDIKTITGIFVPMYADHPEISEAVKANVDKIARTDDVCFYEHLRVADHYRVGKPYLYFDTPKFSTCTVKFRVLMQEDHTLTLRHCFKGRWGDNGEIEVKLNGTKLDQTWGLAPTLDDFGDEDIALPRAMLNLHPEINVLIIRLKGGAYHLLDVFLPALPRDCGYLWKR